MSHGVVFLSKSILIFFMLDGREDEDERHADEDSDEVDDDDDDDDDEDDDDEEDNEVTAEDIIKLNKLALFRFFIFNIVIIVSINLL